jgi:calcineurin B family protein 1
MGSKASIQLREEDIRKFQEETGFSANQIVRLYSRFTSLDKSGNGYLSCEDFLRIPELAINPLSDRIVHAFFVHNPTNDSVNVVDGVTFPQFLKTLAHFRPVKSDCEGQPNSRMEKLKVAFKIYDLDNDGKISREELLAVLHMMVGSNISEDQLASIADRTILEADMDSDGFISLPDFISVMGDTDVEQKMSVRFLN